MGWYDFFCSCFRLIFSTIYRWRVIGAEHIPNEGAVILCANHVSNWDPPLLGSVTRRHVRFMAKEELFRTPVLSYLLPRFGTIPVKRGAGDRAAIRAALKLLEDGEVLGIFPEGTRSKTGEVGQGLSGVSMFALKSEATLIPVAIIGPYRLFRPVTIILGKPLDLSEQRAKKADAELLKETTEIIMDSIKTLLHSYKS